MDSKLALVADGDERMRNLLQITLKAHDYKCITTNSGESATILARSNTPSIVLTELSFADIDGTEVIRTIRSFSNVPIIVISDRKDDHDKVMALDTGADDYLIKPFSVEELLARMRVMERRVVHKQPQVMHASVFENGDLTIDYGAGCVYVRCKELHFTPIEYRLICMLSQHVGKVLTATDITREIWGNSFDHTMMTLRTFVASVRKKIRQAGSEEACICTHTGVGYRMVRITK
ncbi:MAG: response regulator transcription factor [Ruminococcaceae bacterium]|nr:response regulator transcription factor [Oscillospiraceae bacterium]